MTSKELQQYLLREFPQENACCEWKEMKNLKNSFAGDEKNDVISYVSLKKKLGIAKVICKPPVLVPKTAQNSSLSKLGEMAHV